MGTVFVTAPCKINLSLDILGRRPDGYHEMEMVMQSVSLADQVTLTENGLGEIRIHSDCAGLPCDRSNLAYRAAEAYFQAVGSKRIGLDITIQKRVPSQAGLGGGSADGAAVLVGLNELLKGGLPPQELAAIGAQVGADLPFCLLGGTRLVTGIGERTERVAPLPDCAILLAKPQAGVSTPEAFARFDRQGLGTAGGTGSLLAALERRDLTGVGKALFNVLEPVCGLSQVDDLVEQMTELGALGARMSGSGSAVFGLFEDPEQAERCRLAVESQGYWVCSCRPLDHGAAVLSR